MAGQRENLEWLAGEAFHKDIPLTQLYSGYRMAYSLWADAKKNARERANLGREDLEYIEAQYVADKAEGLVKSLDKAIMISMYLGKREKYG